MDDESLLEWLKGAEPDRDRALKYLYRHEMVKRSVFNYVLTTGGQDHDAEDILQEGVIALLENVLAGQFRAGSALTTYLIAICRNLWKQRLRRSGRTDLHEDMTALDEPGAETPEVLLLAMEAENMDEKRIQIVRSLVGRLGENCRTYFRLYYEEMLRLRDIAEQVALKNEKQVKKALARCRDRLRNLINDDPDLEKFLRNRL